MPRARKIPQDPNRLLVERAHPDDRLDPGKLGRPGTQRRVSVNLRGDPLSWLHARGHVSARQLAAGERLRGDYERAQLAPRVTMRWDNAASASHGRRAGPSPPELSAAGLDARRRFHGALDSAGPGLTDILWRTVCAGEGMGEAERALGWPTRSGRLVLSLALDRVAGFYGLR